MTRSTPRPRKPRPRADRPPSTTIKRAFGIISVLLVVQAALAFLMVYPSYKPTPHGVPVGYVGNRATEARLSKSTGSAFSIRPYRSERAARDAIEQRTVYGALIVRDGHEHLLVASGASPAVAQLLTETVAAPLPRPTAAVTDIAPLSTNDPHGATINALVLPLVSISLLAAIALGALRLRRWGLLGGLAAFSLLGGVGVMAVVGVGLGALPGPFFALAGVMALTILAITASTAGLQQLLGKAGVPLAALIFLFIGSPASANGTAPQMLPDFWRQIGQFLPLGASGSSIRNISYFHANALTSPLLVLSAFILAGAAGLMLADIRKRNHQSATAAESATPHPAIAQPATAA